jgi:heat shock protein HslJ
LRKLTLFALAVAMLGIVAGCGANDSDKLIGRDWHLTAITEKVPAFQGVIAPEDQGKYVITFNTDNTYNGTADCNKIAGTYKTSGSNGLTINPGISTLATA